MARTTTLPMRVTYELGSDVLLATCEPPQDAVSEEKAPDLFLRLSHAVGEVIGFECLEFSRHAQDAAWLKSLPDVGAFLVDGRSLTLAAVLHETWAALTARPFEREVEFIARP